MLYVIQSQIRLFPAHAGVILGILTMKYRLLTIPRTRGGDPHPRSIIFTVTDYSPHTRG